MSDREDRMKDRAAARRRALSDHMQSLYQLQGHVPESDPRWAHYDKIIRKHESTLFTTGDDLVQSDSDEDVL